jgi:hypothetical protein
MGAYKNICGRNRKHGRGPCTRPAGWGTDHPGEGACKLHGGNSKRGRENGNYKHGLNSKYVTPEDNAEFEEWKETSSTDFDKLSPQDEFALFRLERAQVQSGDKMTPKQQAEVLDRIMDIRLKAQKLRGGEQQQDINVNINAREELLSRIAGLAARRREAGAAGGPDGGAGA